MPIEHSIAHDKYIVFQAADEVTGAEIISANRWLYSLEFSNRNLARFQLWDFSLATLIIVDIDRVLAMAQQDKQAAQSLEQLVIACVAPDDLIYGLSRMWQAFADDEAIDAHIFRDLGSAETWMLDKIAQIAPDTKRS